MAIESLEAAIKRTGSALDVMRALPNRPHNHHIVAEHTNWQSEQHAWLDACVLMDQSHHMTNLLVTGQDALRLIGDLGVNSVASFPTDRAKQLVVCNDEGYYIGDVILFRFDEQTFNLVGRDIAINWVQYHLESGDYDATAERDENSLVRRGQPPKSYRYEVQGPLAKPLVEKLSGAPIPDIKFFNVGWFDLAGHRVRGLRHGMAGQDGYEFFGPWAEGEAVRQAIVEAGAEFGLREVGALAYSTSNLESGWLPAPFPAVFTGESARGFREWLAAGKVGSLGGSFDSAEVTDFYLTPYELGYGRSVAFDHDFLGRAALEAHAADQRRVKATLIWDAADVTAAIGSLYTPGPTAKFINMPKARYATYQVDKVLVGDRVVGVSTDCGYLANFQSMVSIAVLDTEFAKPGTEVTVTWGEHPISSKPQVEPHVQVAIRATVAPVPISSFARSVYRDR